MSGGTWPGITVVTPSFNQGAYIEATLRSVLDQNYPNLEYIVLDGGSSDESVRVIERYAPRLTYWHSRPDRGQSDAIATGFDMATGDILCWLNSDDILLPGSLQHVARIFRDSPRTKFVYGNRHVIDAQGQVIGSHRWPHLLHRYHWALGQPLAQECAFWRRSLYEEVGGLDRSRFFIMDWDLFYRMWKVTRLRKTSRFLGCIRIHEETKNTRHQDTRERELREAHARYGVTQPGRIIRALMNRADKLQLWLETRRERRHGTA
jgi:glycosyltransferase involved in cell wall biosynthesis